ncbi:AAA family ATPase [Oleispirillum naphthae]|uniref:AAA family ATPase n=1 Tax=Oleispirillum naphthae TaxID=2838853 RepID=UPI0030823733
MKLVRAEFQNFRLLRDLEINFSTDSERRLTVIRAANETGKTTILTALQWALYGDAALPGRGEDYRLHPIDWNIAQGKRVPVTVSVEFEVAKYHKAASGLKETRHRRRLIRSAFEEIDGSSWRRSPSTVKLFALADHGTAPLAPPESYINDELPPELREIFFTDGDRALSFIEADVALSTKRDRVQKAIRSLLGLSVIEKAIGHINRTAAEVNRLAKKAGMGADLGRIASQLEEIKEDIAKHKADKEDARQQFMAFDERINEIDKKIAAALQKGDKDKLRRDMEEAKKEITRIDDRIVAANKDHSALFRSLALARDLLAPVLQSAFDILDKKRNRQDFPKMAIPVLEDRLNAEVCICGASLDCNSADGSARRSHIHKLIEDSRSSDALQAIVTDLYFSSKPLQPQVGGESSGWIADYTKVVENRDTLQNLREDAGKRFRALELQLDALPDTDIQGLRETLRKYKDQRDRFLYKESSLETQLANLNRDCEFLTAERDRMLREQKKGTRILSELEVTQDVIRVLDGAYKQITNEELAKVSELMNRTFLEMIGADPKQGAIIQRAEISPEFDIIVYGPNEHTLNPDRDLNGASRRALTLAFILALTKVSDVEAPNVIDTPLGMMSGYVKRSVLRTAIRESAQLVLFLTHSEIAGCEELLDEAAGVIFTLTNPAHYPKMLINDPGVSDRKVLRCDCNHKRECQVCQRRQDADLELDLTS